MSLQSRPDNLYNCLKKVSQLPSVQDLPHDARLSVATVQVLHPTVACFVQILSAHYASQTGFWLHPGLLRKNYCCDKGLCNSMNHSTTNCN